MEVLFKGQDVATDEALQDYARRRIGRLDRFLPMAREAVVEVRREKARAAQQRFIVQVTVNVNGTFLRAEERAAEARPAVDAAASALGAQVRRHKDKLYRSGRSTQHARHQEEMAELRQVMAELSDSEEEEERELIAGHVVRVKHFAMKPMTVEEAVEQMELLGHNFFLFLNAAESRYAMLYRRRDGDYGLIMPA